jgi:hypothetical protein
MLMCRLLWVELESFWPRITQISTNYFICGFDSTQFSDKEFVPAKFQGTCNYRNN